MEAEEEEDPNPTLSARIKKFLMDRVLNKLVRSPSMKCKVSTLLLTPAVGFLGHPVVRLRAEPALRSCRHHLWAPVDSVRAVLHRYVYRKGAH